MRNLSIYGVGCPKSGGKVVLTNIVNSLSRHFNLNVWIPAGATEIATFKTNFYVIPNWISNSFFRPFWEFFFGCVIQPYYSKIVLNISNYGFCVGSHSILLIHSPDILNRGFTISLSGKIKNILLQWSLMQADVVLLQTDHMRQDLADYCFRKCVRLPPVLGFMPRVKSRTPKPINKPFRVNSKFNLFYPASSFPHKRIDLCEKLGYTKLLQNTIIHVTNSTLVTDVFKGLGSLTHSNVLSRFESVDALLFTSEMETLGLPLLEAISFGLPAVLPDLPYAHEIYGSAAVYFKDFTIESIANAIVELQLEYDEYKIRADLRLQELIAKGNLSEERLLDVLDFFNKSVI